MNVAEGKPQVVVKNQKYNHVISAQCVDEPTLKVDDRHMNTRPSGGAGDDSSENGT